MSKIKPIADIFEELGRDNPAYREALKANPLADTPMFDATEQQPLLTPPKKVYDSTTQRESWDKLQNELGTNQLLVLAAIEEIGPATFKDLCRKLNWEINAVTPRVGELRDQFGLVIEFDRVPDPSRLCSRWVLNPERFPDHYNENASRYQRRN